MKKLIDKLNKIKFLIMWRLIKIILWYQNIDLIPNIILLIMINKKNG